MHWTRMSVDETSAAKVVGFLAVAVGTKPFRTNSHRVLYTDDFASVMVRSAQTAAR